jgi:alkylation response protein AidB-like acyl-CoA dehydrogenase
MTATEVRSTDDELVSDQIDRLLADHDPAGTQDQDFLGFQFDAGLAWVHFPVGLGGLGVSRKLQPAVNDRLRQAGAPNWLARNAIGYGMAAPTILAHGSEDQKQRYLRPLFTCEHVWCQLFSEPGAGSDVAGLATKAVRDGDEWVANGQKVWTTLAHTSRYGMLLARTNPDAEKHKGLTYFVVDMHAPGVEVRPLRQMTGDAEFNEVYFTDARIPDTERLSDVGEGWGHHHADERTGLHRGQRGRPWHRGHLAGPVTVGEAGRQEPGLARPPDCAVDRVRSPPADSHPGRSELGGGYPRPRGIHRQAARC